MSIPSIYFARALQKVCWCNQCMKDVGSQRCMQFFCSPSLLNKLREFDGTSEGCCSRTRWHANTSRGLWNNMFTICSMLEILALKIKHPLPSNNPWEHLEPPIQGFNFQVWWPMATTYPATVCGLGCGRRLLGEEFASYFFRLGLCCGSAGWDGGCWWRLEFDECPLQLARNIIFDLDGCKDICFFD